MFQRSRIPLTREFSVRPEENWGDWAAEVWDQFSSSTRFAVRRELSVLRELYSATPRLRIHRVLKGEVTIGWSASFLTQMQNNSYFGNLLVGTILDLVCSAGRSFAGSRFGGHALARGADLVITNQSLSLWREPSRMPVFGRVPLQRPSRLPSTQSLQPQSAIELSILLAVMGMAD